MEDTQNEQVQPDTEVETTETVEEQEPQEEEIVVPDNWEPALKDFIGGIKDQAGKRAVFDKLNNFEKGYQKKFQELAEERKAYETDKKAFDENRALFDSYSLFEKSLDPQRRSAILARYGNVPNYMQTLYQSDLLASTDPAQFLQNYCANNGITAENLQEFLSGNQYRQAYQDRTMESSQEALKAQIMKELEAKQKQEQYERQVTDFYNAKSEAGEMLHPLMNDQSFVKDMEALQKAYPDKSLEDLYKMASYLRPDLRQQAIDEEAKKLTEAKEVEKAKSAVGVKPQVPTHNPKPDKSWQQVLSESLDTDDE